MIGAALAAAIAGAASVHDAPDSAKYAATAVAEYAYMVGLCEQFYDRASADQAVADLTGVAAKPGGDLPRRLRALWVQKYGEGRRDASRRALSAEQCAEVVDGSARDAAAALRALQGP